jgi:hypothetical protein
MLHQAGRKPIEQAALKGSIVLTLLGVMSGETRPSRRDGSAAGSAIGWMLSFGIQHTT